MRRITKTLRLRRNTQQAICELHERHSSVATDSVFGGDSGQSRRMVISGSMVGREFVVNLQWESRDDWQIQIEGRSFQIYDTASHKYWLRGLIRRCR